MLYSCNKSISAAEFPNEASIDGIAEHDMIKVLANTSIKPLACSYFATLSGNTDSQLHHTSQIPGDQSDDEVDSDEEEWEEEPLRDMHKVKIRLF